MANRAEHDRRYAQTDKGRERQRRANERYRATTKGIIAEARNELARLRRESSESED